MQGESGKANALNSLLTSKDLLELVEIDELRGDMRKRKKKKRKRGGKGIGAWYGSRRTTRSAALFPHVVPL